MVFILSWSLLLLSLMTSYDAQQTTKSNQNAANFNNLSLKQICTMFKVSPLNCTCEFMVDQRTGKSFCEVKSNHKIKVTRSDNRDLDVLQAASTLAASVVAVAGNALVIAVSVKNRNTFGRCRFLIAALAVCDAFFGIVQSISVISLFWTPFFLLGSVMCKILLGLHSLSSFYAMGIIVVIAVERYMGIVHPFSHGLSLKSTVSLLAVNCILGLCAVLPQFIYNDITEAGSCQQIWPSQRDAAVYSWTILVIMFLVPVLAVSYFYISIMVHLSKSLKDCDGLSTTDSKLKQKRLKDTKRVMLILCTVLIAFVLLTFPNRLVWVVVDTIGANEVGNIVNILKRVSYITYVCHVSVNPIIYTLIDSKIRRDIKTILLCYRPGKYVTSDSKDTIATVLTEEQYK